MLWYKSWLETRWRFVIGLALLTLSGVGMVMAYPQLIKLLPAAGTLDTTGPLGERIREGLELARDYRGYIWSEWIRDSFMQMGTLFAVILGSGGPFFERSELFTLSLPASRNRLLGVRAAAGLAELFVLAFVPMLLMPLLAPSVGQSYGVGQALAYGTCFFVAGSAFFSLAVLLSTSFSDMWRPLMITLAVAVVIWLCEMVLRGFSDYSVFHLMAGEEFFRTGRLPWMGLAAGVAGSAALLYGASINIGRRDF